MISGMIRAGLSFSLKVSCCAVDLLRVTGDLSSTLHSKLCFVPYFVLSIFHQHIHFSEPAGWWPFFHCVASPFSDSVYCFKTLPFVFLGVDRLRSLFGYRRSLVTSRYI
ncbi:hypothetical protein ACMYSQ_001957 [Aspergillus niger]